MAKKVLPAVLALILLLSACGSRLPSPTGTPAHQEPSPTVAPTPESTPYDGPVSPLSGLPMSKEWVNRRPVAIMLNNLKEALPQLGQSQADVIYEVPAEGGITRMPGRLPVLGTVLGKSAPSAPPAPTTWSWPWDTMPSTFTPAAARMPTPKSANGASPPSTESMAPT